MKIFSPSRDDLKLRRGIYHCVSFYYNLGEDALLDVGVSTRDTNDIEWLWNNQFTDLTGHWLRGEATLYSAEKDFVVSCNLDNYCSRSAVEFLLSPCLSRRISLFTMPQQSDIPSHHTSAVDYLFSPCLFCRIFVRIQCFFSHHAHNSRISLLTRPPPYRRISRLIMSSVGPTKLVHELSAGYSTSLNNSLTRGCLLIRDLHHKTVNS